MTLIVVLSNSKGEWQAWDKLDRAAIHDVPSDLNEDGIIEALDQHKTKVIVSDLSKAADMVVNNRFLQRFLK
jgi:hypothetical protein